MGMRALSDMRTRSPEATTTDIISGKALVPMLYITNMLHVQHS